MVSESLSAPVMEQEKNFSDMAELLVVDTYLKCFGNSIHSNSTVFNGLKERFYNLFSSNLSSSFMVIFLSLMVLCPLTFLGITYFGNDSEMSFVVILVYIVLFCMSMCFISVCKELMIKLLKKEKRKKFFKCFDVKWSGKYENNGKEIYFMLKAFSTFFKNNGTYEYQKGEMEIHLNNYMMLDKRSKNYNKDVENILNIVYENLLKLVSNLYKADKNILLKVWKERRKMHLESYNSSYKEHLLNKLGKIQG